MRIKIANADVLLTIVEGLDSHHEIDRAVRDDDADGLLTFLPLLQQLDALRRRPVIAYNKRICVVWLREKAGEGQPL